MLNVCNFIGNLGADPEIKAMSNGDKVCNLSLAVTEKWKDKNGEKKEKTEWVRITIWSQGLIGVAEKYLKKGAKVFISGKMQTRKWQDKDGQDKYSTEIVLQGFDAKLIMLDGKSSSDGSTGYYDKSRNNLPDNSSHQDPLNDEIPF